MPNMKGLDLLKEIRIELDEVDSDSESFIYLSISYKRKRVGAIVLIASDKTAKSLAYNILDIDEDGVNCQLIFNGRFIRVIKHNMWSTYYKV